MKFENISQKTINSISKNFKKFFERFTNKVNKEDILYLTESILQKMKITPREYYWFEN